MDEPMSFGVWLRRCRGVLGLTQRVLAAHLGYAFSTYRKLEAGERRPSITFLGRLADYLGVSAAERELLFSFGLTGACDHAQNLLQHILTRSQQGLPEPACDRLIVLPHPPTRLIGRDADLDDLITLLRRPLHRLVTLVGPPGVGKTHLALHAATIFAAGTADFADGVVFISLASFADPHLVIPTIAHTLGVIEGQQPLVQILTSFLRERQLLLLLDNLEQVREAASMLAELLGACPGVTILATSRAPLNVRAEQQFAVSPLALPNLEQSLDRATLARIPAITLFVERAQAVQRDFQLTDANSDAIVRLCVQLDGLPLALELAAVHIKLFSPAELLESITDRLSLLTAGPRDLPPRQQSLRTAIARSYELLTEVQRILFMRLSVFVGGGTLVSITAICTDRASSLDTVRTITDLLDQSLLQCTASPVQRVHMLETIQAYAREQMIARGEWDWMRERHAAYYSEWAMTLVAGIRSSARISIEHQLESDLDNLRAALRWYFTHRPLADTGARLASALCTFWWGSGYLTEGRAWLEEAVALLEQQHDQNSRVVGEPCSNQSFLTDLHAQTYHALGVITTLQGDYLRAQTALEMSLHFSRRATDAYGIGQALYWLGVVAHQQGDMARAQLYCQDSLTHFHGVGAQQKIADVYFELGLLAAQLQHNLPQATALLQQSLTYAQAIDDSLAVADARFGLGLTAYLAGEDQQVRIWLDRDVVHDLQQYDRRRCVQALHLLAAAIGRTGDSVRAARIWGAAERTGSAMGFCVPPSYQALYNQPLQRMRMELGEAAFAAAREEGQVLSLAQAVDEAYPL